MLAPSPIVLHRFQQRRLDNNNHGDHPPLESVQQLLADSTSSVLSEASLITSAACGTSTGAFEHPAARRSSMVSRFTHATPSSGSYSHADAKIPSSAMQNDSGLPYPPVFLPSPSFLSEPQQGFLKPRSFDRRSKEEDEWTINTVESRPVVTAKIVYESPAPASRTNHSSRPAAPPPPPSVNEGEASMSGLHSVFDFRTPPANKKALRPRPMRLEEPTQGISRVTTTFQQPPPRQPSEGMFLPFLRSSPHKIHRHLQPAAAIQAQQQSWESQASPNLQEHSLPQFPKF